VYDCFCALGTHTHTHTQTHSHSLSQTHTHSLTHTHTHTHSHSLTHTHSLSLTHTHTLSLTHTHTNTLTHTHTHTHSLTHKHTHTHTHSLSLTHTHCAAGEEEREEMKMCALLQVRTQLAGYCKLIIYGVLELRAATDILKYYNKVSTKHQPSALILCCHLLVKIVISCHFNLRSLYFSN